MIVRRRNFIYSVCLPWVLFFHRIKEVNGHTSGQTSGIDSHVIRHAEVKDLLLRAEALLKKFDGAGALNLFEQAALIVHSSEVEVGIVRAHMQAGQFERALSFCAHASGAHLDEPAPTILYAHLLRLSGQTAHAEKLFKECAARFGEKLLKTAKVRLTPYFDAAGLPPQAKMIGSGLRLPHPQQVAIPASMIRMSKKFWVRFGNGVLSRAFVEHIQDQSGLAILRTEKLSPQIAGEKIVIAGKSVFPGSVAFGLHFNEGSSLGWPLLWTSFIGNPPASNSSGGTLAKLSGRRALLIPKNTASALGATIFDQTGAAIGLLAPIERHNDASKLYLVPLAE